MRKNAFDRAKATIEQYFDKSSRKAFTKNALEKIFHKQRTYWGIPETKRGINFIAYLKQQSWIHIWKFYIRSSNDEITIYSWKTSDELTVISGLKNKAYFTHYSAMFIHSLTEQIPKTYYLNFEHSGPMAKRDSRLAQEAIDKAFSKEQRKAGEQYRFNRINIILLNGQYTNRLGVTDYREGQLCYSYTDLPRTLIDITIRPTYAGGVFEVLKAYENARNKLNFIVLQKYLDELDFIYPYHQAVGFYMDKTGYPESALALFEKKIELNFYLTYNMKNPQFDSRWKLYYPRGLETMSR